MIKRFLTPKNERVKFDVKSIYTGHHNVTYRDIKAIRSPFDYVIYQMIIFSTKPDLVIEIGTKIGGGALYIADLLNIIGHGILHSIDIERQSFKIVEEHPRIKLFYDGWENYDLKNTGDFKKILVIDDASHMYEDTYAAMNKFAPVVSADSYLIIEDGIINELGQEKPYNGGPLKAIREFLKQHSEFIVDRTWCDFFGQNATFNVNGYLKRIT